MNLEEAIQTAITYEKKIRDLYVEASSRVTALGGGTIFDALAKDEAYHVSYLEKKLREFQKKGEVSADALRQNIPKKGDIEKSVESLRKSLMKDHRSLVQDLLSRALAAEVETSAFYGKTVVQLNPSGQKLFRMFLEMENNHIDAVQFELDYISGTGYWFGFKEFDME